jgi:hypothetical protein
MWTIVKRSSSYRDFFFAFSVNPYAACNKSHTILRCVYTYLQCVCENIDRIQCIPTVWVSWNIDTVNKCCRKNKSWKPFSPKSVGDCTMDDLRSILLTHLHQKTTKRVHGWMTHAKMILLLYITFTGNAPNKNRRCKMHREKKKIFLLPEFENFCAVMLQKIFVDGWSINFQRLKADRFLLWCIEWHQQFYSIPDLSILV